MADLFNHDNNFFKEKLKKINSENKILNKGGKNLKNLKSIKSKQIQALEKILNNLSDFDLSYLNSSQIDEITIDQKDILNEIKFLQNYII